MGASRKHITKGDLHNGTSKYRNRRCVYPETERVGIGCYHVVEHGHFSGVIYDRELVVASSASIPALVSQRTRTEASIVPIEVPRSGKLLHWWS
jgi:hypothetical protein